MENKKYFQGKKAAHNQGWSQKQKIIIVIAVVVVVVI